MECQTEGVNYCRVVRSPAIVVSISKLDLAQASKELVIANGFHVAVGREEVPSPPQSSWLFTRPTRSTMNAQSNALGGCML